MKAQEIIELYSQYAKEYDKAVFEERDYIAYATLPAWIVARLPKAPPAAQILDLGCGTGLSALAFFEAAHLVTGVDISPEMIEQATLRPYQRLHCQSLESPLPFPSHLFDGAVMLGVMEFIHDPLSLFREVGRVLKTGGLFGLTVPQKLTLEEGKRLDIFSYTHEEIAPLFRAAGFDVLRCESLQGFVSQGISVHYHAYLCVASLKPS